MNLICSRAAILALLLAGAPMLHAAEAATHENALKPALRNGPMAEMPARAASLVKQSRIRQRETTTIEVVACAIEINSVAAPSIVGAISKAVPEMADVAAGQAASMLPKESTKIARAAAAAAPSMAGKILIAVCRTTPKQYRQIAISISEVAPTAGKDILRSVAVVEPDLKPQMDRQLAGYGLTMPPVGDTLAIVAPVPIISATTPIVVGTVGASSPPVGNLAGSSVPTYAGNGASTPATLPALVSVPTVNVPSPVPPATVASSPISRGAPPAPPVVGHSHPPTNAPPPAGPPPPGGRNYARP